MSEKTITMPVTQLTHIRHYLQMTKDYFDSIEDNCFEIDPASDKDNVVLVESIELTFKIPELLTKGVKRRIDAIDKMLEKASCLVIGV